MVVRVVRRRMRGAVDWIIVVGGAACWKVEGHRVFFHGGVRWPTYL
jgi:hypothetical protein